MDTLLFLPKAPAIPTPARQSLAVELEALGFTSEDFDQNTATLDALSEENQTRFYSRNGDSSTSDRLLAIAKKHNFPMAVQLDGAGETNTYDWNHKSTLNWYDPATGELHEDAAGSIHADPQRPYEEVVAMLKNHALAAEFLQRVQILNDVGATSIDISDTSRSMGVEVESYDPEKYTLGAPVRKVEVEATKEGLRILLDGENGPDIYIEARKGGWHIFAHETAEDEPAAKIEILEGKIPRAIQLESTPGKVQIQREMDSEPIYVTPDTDPGDEDTVVIGAGIPKAAAQEIATFAQDTLNRQQTTKTT